VFERITRTGTIRCGYAVWNPILTKDLTNGQIGGMSYEIMEAIGKKLDLRIDWAEEASWGTIIEGLKTNRYDMICNGIGIVGARAKAIAFSKPWGFGPQYLVVRADETRLYHAADLNDASVRIVVLDGEGFSLSAPKQFPKAQFHSLPQNSDWSMIFEDVVTGKADATGVAMSDFVRFNKNNPGKLKILNVAEPLQMWPVAFGLPQNDAALATMINAALDEVLADGTVAHAMQSVRQDPNEFLLPSNPYANPSP
jgi:ABC-type amino acid transport substrate-binding protein